MRQLPSSISILLPLVFLHTTFTLAQSEPSTSLAIWSNASSTYDYYGCYNETTGLNGTDGTRALSGGKMEALNNMTVQNCLTFCSNGSAVGEYAYAGLEYGRECWCADYLSALAARLDNASCDLPCDANSSQACGGPLILSVYFHNATAASAAVQSCVSWAGVVVAAVVGLGVVFAEDALGI